MRTQVTGQMANGGDCDWRRANKCQRDSSCVLPLPLPVPFQSRAEQSCPQNTLAEGYTSHIFHCTTTTLAYCTTQAVSGSDARDSRPLPPPVPAAAPVPHNEEREAVAYATRPARKAAHTTVHWSWRSALSIAQFSDSVSSALPTPLHSSPLRSSHQRGIRRAAAEAATCTALCFCS